MVRGPRFREDLLELPEVADEQALRGSAVELGDSFDNALEISLISKGALKAFKTSWSGKFVPKDPTCHHPGCQYEPGEFKAGFNVTGTGEMERIVVPMTEYTSSWSDFTGGCHDHGAVCCSAAHPEVCPDAKALSAVTQVGIWGEGTAGQFELDIKSVRAIKLP